MNIEENMNNKNPNNGDAKFRLICYANDVGNIIGEGGNRIKSIKEESKCYIKFVGPTWKGNRLLHVSGSLDGIGKAVELISKLLIEARSERNNLEQIEEGDKEFISLRFLIPASQCGALIGSGGATISQIKKDTNTRIGIDPTSLPFSNDRICRLSGSPSDLAKCFLMIINLLSKNPPKKNHKNFKILPKVPNELHNLKNNNGSTAECNTVKLHLSKTLIGSLIGKGGCHINQVRDFTGAKIEINTSSHPDESEIVISGNPKAVAAANFFIDTRLSAVNFKKPLGSMNPKNNKNHMNSSYNDDKHPADVPTSMNTAVPLNFKDKSKKPAFTKKIAQQQ